MTFTFAPPQPPGIHDVTTQTHSDGAWYATCGTCGWHSAPCATDQIAMVLAGQHTSRATTPTKKSRANLIVAVATGLFAIFVVAAVAMGDGPSEETPETQRVPVPASRVDDLPVFFVNSRDACLDRVVRVRIETGYDLTARYDGLTGRCVVIPTP